MFFVSPGNESKPINTTEPDCYFGVSFCGNTTAEAKLLIDRVKNYTNLFVLQSGPVCDNETATNEVCNYAVDAGLDLIVFFGDITQRSLQYKLEIDNKDLFWRMPWLTTAKQRWGDSILGIYYYDEPAGKWLDWEEWDTFLEIAANVSDYLDPTSNPTYEDAAEVFVEVTKMDEGFQMLKDNSLIAYTSDYVLYWFDYLTGYDVIFAEIGWNHTMEQDIGLIRGAANLQNKAWGTIITWKYNHPPYLDTPENIYEQMITSYETGADYIIIFNYPTYPEENQYGAMTDEHFDALETFWNKITQNQIAHDSINAEAVLVLPKGYGWGMRSIQDRIWAFWEPDEQSEQIWIILHQLLDHYGTRLDIVYDDPNYPVTGKYQQIYYRNQTSTTP
jgi:hypothetical protein